MIETLRNIFKVNLGVKKNERVLIFNDKVPDNVEVDKIYEDRFLKLRCLSLFLSEMGKSYCKTIIHHEYITTGSHGAEPPEELWRIAFGEKTVESLKRKGLLETLLKKTADEDTIRKAKEIIEKFRRESVDCVIALSNYSTSHTRFRDFLTTICKCRYASMPLFDISMLEGAMNVNWKALSQRTKKLAGIVNKAESIALKTYNGSYLIFSKKGRKALSDTGILTKAGSFGNLPAGEVFLAPVEGTANGKLILEWAPTRKLETSITLIVNNGIVVNVLGDEEYVGYLLQKFSENRNNANIAEFGIGTNDAAKRPDNILESEKILGTIHIALGDNSSFGGNVKTPFHQDFVFFKPTVTLIKKNGEREVILKGGKLVC